MTGRKNEYFLVWPSESYHRYVPNSVGLDATWQFKSNLELSRTHIVLILAALSWRDLEATSNWHTTVWPKVPNALSILVLSPPYFGYMWAFKRL